MYQYLALICFAAHASLSQGLPTSNEVVPDQELLLAFVVNRHGERTPDAEELSLSNEQEKLRNLTAIDGPEALTIVGKRRAYQIGKFLRQRYGSQGHGIISNLYLSNEIDVRTTDKDRTKMTIQVAMAAAYPPEIEQQWDEGVGKVWQPVPYQVVPLSMDYLRYYSNCERYKTLMAEAKRECLQEEFKQFDSLIPSLKVLTGRNFTEDPLLFQSLFDLIRSQVSLGMDIPEWAKPLLPKLGEAARLAYMLYFRTEEMKKLGGGVLLNEFVEAAHAIASGKSISKPLRLFSSHDFNIGALMEVAKVKNDQTIPTYGAVFALELYKSRSTGELSVMPVYLPQAGGSTARVLRFHNCELDDYCSFSKFEEATKQYLLPEKEFYAICNIRTELG